MLKRQLSDPRFLNLASSLERYQVSKSFFAEAGLVWSGLVWSGMVWCGVVWCGDTDAERPELGGLRVGMTLQTEEVFREQCHEKNIGRPFQ